MKSIIRDGQLKGGKNLIIILLMGLFTLSFGRSFGVPETGFTKTFEDSSLAGLSGTAFTMSSSAIKGKKSLLCAIGGSTYYASAYLNNIHTGEDPGWIRLSQGTVSAIMKADSTKAQPGVGFISDSGNGVFAYLDFVTNSLCVMKRRNNGTDSQMLSQVIALDKTLPYKVELCWSPYANTMLATVYTQNDTLWDYGASIRALALAQDARHPALVCTGGRARFDDMAFDPNLDNWNYEWEFDTTTILDPEQIGTLPVTTNYANAVHWKWKKDGKFYMHMRNGITYSSSDAIAWTKMGTSIINYPSDPCYLVDPFNDGCVYVSSRVFPWIKNNGVDHFVKWDTVKTMGLNNHGLKGALQDIIDVRQHPALLDSIPYNGKKYRFIGIGEYTFDPFSTVILSNDLTTWVRPDTINFIPARFSGYGWQDNGDAIGCGYPMADGNVLILCCTCVNGYTGTGFDATNVASILDAKQPWLTKRVSRLPMTPALSTGWIKGPNMPNSFVYDDAKDILYFFSDFGDTRQGLLRVKNFSKQDMAATAKPIRIQAEMNTNQNGIAYEACTDSGLGADISTHTTNWISFKNLNFRSGVSFLDLRLASNNGGGVIEIHMDSVGGRIAGSYTVVATGGWQTWTTVQVPLTNVNGMHDIFITFTKSDAIAIANLNWIEIPGDATRIVKSPRAVGPVAQIVCKVLNGRLLVTAHEACMVELVTMQGRSVAAAKGRLGQTVVIRTSGIAKGLYMLCIRSSRENVRKPVVVF